jgi:hypothetical protein
VIQYTWRPNCWKLIFLYKDELPPSATFLVLVPVYLKLPVQWTCPTTVSSGANSEKGTISCSAPPPIDPSTWKSSSAEWCTRILTNDQKYMKFYCTLTFKTAAQTSFLYLKKPQIGSKGKQSWSVRALWPRRCKVETNSVTLLQWQEKNRTFLELNNQTRLDVQTHSSWLTNSFSSLGKGLPWIMRGPRTQSRHPTEAVKSVHPNSKDNACSNQMLALSSLSTSVARTVPPQTIFCRWSFHSEESQFEVWKITFRECH